MEVGIPAQSIILCPISLSANKNQATKANGSTENSSPVRIQIGSEHYALDLKEFPYLKAYLNFLRHSGRLTTRIPTHDAIPFFGVIIHCLKHGFRHFFSLVPPDLSSYRALCDSIEFLGVDVLKGQNIHHIMNELRWPGRSGCRPGGASPTRGSKTAVGDAAFTLVYQYLLGEFATGKLGAANRDADLAFNAVMFVVSHTLVFSWKIRKVVRDAFEDRFILSRRQRRALNTYPVEDRACDVAQEEGEKMAEEEDGTDMGRLANPA